MSLVPNVQVFPVYEQGEYICLLTSVLLAERTPFGGDQGAKEPCFKFTFQAVNADRSPAVSEEGKPVLLYQTTGVTYGGSRATLTKLTNMMLGEVLSEENAARFDYEKLQSNLFKLLVTKEPDTNGDMKNKIASVSPLVQININACLVPVSVSTDTL